MFYTLEETNWIKLNISITISSSMLANVSPKSYNDCCSVVLFTDPGRLSVTVVGLHRILLLMWYIDLIMTLWSVWRIHADQAWLKIK